MVHYTASKCSGLLIFMFSFPPSSWMYVMEGGHFTSCTTHPVFLHLQACHLQKQPKAHSAHPQNVPENQVLPASSRCQQLCVNRPTFKPWLLTLLFASSRRPRQRGDARETTTDRREGGGKRRGPRDAQTEEPSALLSLPNQTRVGAAGTGLLSLWSVL